MNDSELLQQLQKDVAEMQKQIGVLKYPLDFKTKSAIEQTQFNELNASVIKSGSPTNNGWSDMSSSRAKDTVYSNGVFPILVVATFRCVISVAGGNAYVQAKSDGLTTPTTVASGKIGIEAGLLGEDNSYQIVFMVKPGANYSIASAVTNGTVTLGKWIEIVL